MLAHRLASGVKYSRGVYVSSRTMFQTHSRLCFSSTSSGPATIADTGFWRSLIPKPLRKENRRGNVKRKPKEWNPATFFIAMFLLIGSMSIQMIALRNQSERYNRQTTVKLEQLREALRKLQNGEKVDVNKILGNIDEVQKGTDWEEILKAMERDDGLQATQTNVGKSNEPEARITKSIATDCADGVAAVVTETPPSNSKTANLGNFF